jgi:hypothetical protein
MNHLSGAGNSWVRTRRNVVAMCSIMSAALLTACKQDALLKEIEGRDRHDPNCYLKGTRLLAVRGLKKIEELEIGDRLVTLSGDAEKIQWIGRCSYHRDSDGPWPEHVKPIRIARGALHHDVPHTDLFVSQNHRIYVDGLLIRAADLLNGDTIAIDSRDACTTIEYLHVKTTRHSISFAEGLQSETLLLNEHSKYLFDNFDEFEQSYDSEAALLEEPCAPVYASHGHRDELRSRLKSAMSPWIDRRNQFEILRDRLAG